MTNKSSRGRRNPSPISLRLTQEELTLLKSAAKGQSLSAYIRNRLFCKNQTSDSPDIKNTRLSPQARQQLLAQILSKLGQSGLADSLDDLAYAARIGTLPLTPDVLSEIRTACALIQEIRDLLIRAVGLRPKDSQ